MFHDDDFHERHGKWKAMSAGKKASLMAGGLVMFAAAVAVASLLVMLLWNAVMARVLGLPVFGYWEAAGLFVLAKVLVGGGRGLSFFGRMRLRRAMRASMAMRAQAEGGERSSD